MTNIITKAFRKITTPLIMNRIHREHLEPFYQKERNRAELFRFTIISTPLAIKTIEEYPTQSSGVEYTLFNAYEQGREVDCEIRHNGFNKFSLYISEGFEKPQSAQENRGIDSILARNINIFYSPFLELSSAKGFIKDLEKRTGINLNEQIRRGLKEKYPELER